MRVGYSLDEGEKKVFNKGLSELQKKLIDTTRKNKLLNYRTSTKSRFLKIIDESPDFIYKQLLDKEDKFKFLAIPESEVDLSKFKCFKRKFITVKY